MRTEIKAFGSPSMRSSILERFPREVIFSLELRKRILFPDIVAWCSMFDFPRRKEMLAEERGARANFIEIVR